MGHGCDGDGGDAAAPPRQRPHLRPRASGFLPSSSLRLELPESEGGSPPERLAPFGDFGSVGSSLAGASATFFVTCRAPKAALLSTSSCSSSARKLSDLPPSVSMTSSASLSRSYFCAESRRCVVGSYCSLTAESNLMSCCILRRFCIRCDLGPHNEKSTQ